MIKDNLDLIYYLAIAFITISMAFISFQFSRISRKAALEAEYVSTLGQFIRKMYFRLSQIKQNHPMEKLSVWFVLNELNEAKEDTKRDNPYYDFIESVLELKYTIVYASDRDEVESAIPTLISKIAKNEKNSNDFKHRISFVKLAKFPGGDNLCFVVSNETDLIAAFSGYRAGRATVGGTELQADEALSEWEGLKGVILKK